MTRPSAILLLVLLLPGQAWAQAHRCAGRGTVADYAKDLVGPASEFLATLQRAVAANDRHAVAMLAHYPLRVNGVKGLKEAASPRDFERRYSAILTPHVRAAIMEQQGACLFANWQGVMIGDGEVWFDRVPDGMRIITFNVE